MSEQVTYFLELDALPLPSTASLPFSSIGTQLGEPRQQKEQPMKFSDWGQPFYCLVDYQTQPPEVTKKRYLKRSWFT